MVYNERALHNYFTPTLLMRHTRDERWEGNGFSFILIGFIFYGIAYLDNEYSLTLLSSYPKVSFEGDVSGSAHANIQSSVVSVILFRTSYMFSCSSDDLFN